jgi:hydroxymethylbilane synthase
MAQIRQQYTHLVVSSIRGNLNTRLAKLEGSQIKPSGLVESPGYSALLLAAAGMERIGWKDKIGQILQPTEQLYAVGQGALAIECRANDNTTLSLLAPLHDRISTLRVAAERSLLKTLEGGCSAPVAVHSEYTDEVLKLKAGVWSLDGKKHILKEKSIDMKGLETEDEPVAKKQRMEVRMFAGILAGPLNENELNAAEKLGEDVAAQLVEAGAMEIMSEARADNEQSDKVETIKTAIASIPGRELCLAAQAAGQPSPH